MPILVYNFISTIIFAFLGNNAKSKNAENIFKLIIIIQFSLICGFRNYEVGWDTLNYSNIFWRSSELGFLEAIKVWDIEIGYSLLQYITSRVSSSPTILFAIVALFYSSSVSRFISKYSRSWAVTYALFFSLGLYAFSMSATRQTIALGIILYAYDTIKQKKLLKFLIYVLVASSFHLSALIFLPIYFLSSRNFSNKVAILSIISFSAMFIFKDQLFDLVTTITPYRYNRLDTLGPRNYLIMLDLIFIFSIFFMKRSMHLNNNNNTVYYYSISIAIGLSTFAFLHPAALRLSFYYLFIVIAIFPNILRTSAGSKIYILFNLMLVVLLGYIYLRGLTPDSPFIPYRFVWM